MKVFSPRDVAAASPPPHHHAGILALITGVEEEGIAFSAGVKYFPCTDAPSGPRTRGESGGFGCGNLDGGRAVLGSPLLKATVEDRDATVGVVGEHPPQTGGELTTRVVVNYDVSIITDAQRAHK